LTESFAGAFVRTKPIGYGVWIASPLSRAQMQILAAVVAEAQASEHSAKAAAQFRRACALASAHDLRLHVRLSPPGHTDFGFLTTFPHCPRCKRPSGERWSRHYSRKPKTCPACGQRYVPAETAKSELEDQKEEEAEDLQKVLAADEFGALRAEWLAHHADDPPGFVERFLSGKVDLAAELLKEAEASGGGRRPWWRRLIEWAKR
jgi:hypothetical protein